MGGLDTTTAGFDAALKEVYLPGIREQLNKKTRILNDFTKADIEQLEWEGREAVVSLHKSRNVGVLASSENGLLPTAGNQGYADMKIPMRFIYGRIQLTAQVIKASRSDRGSFARAMDAEQSGLVEDIARQRNRMLCLASRGMLAQVSGTPAMGSSTITVQNPGGVTGTTNAVRFIKAGMVVAIYNGSATGSTLREIQTVLSVSASASTITFVGTTGVAYANGDAITLGATTGGVTQGSLDLEPVGLLGIVDQTSYLTVIHGIDRSLAANTFFLSTIMPSTGSLSPDVLQRGIDNTEEVSGEVIDTFYCHQSVRREVLKLHEGDRRYDMPATMDKPDVGTLAGAFKADLTHDHIPIRVEKDMPYSTLFGVSKAHLFWIPEVEGEWADEDGRILLRLSTSDAYEGRFRVFENFFSDKGNSHLRFDAISATVTTGIFAD